LMETTGSGGDTARSDPTAGEAGGEESSDSEVCSVNSLVTCVRCMPEPTDHIFRLPFHLSPLTPYTIFPISVRLHSFFVVYRRTYRTNLTHSGMPRLCSSGGRKWPSCSRNSSSSAKPKAGGRRRGRRKCGSALAPAGKWGEGL
jgi:hypothetical protein